jgi:hypothetical protein
MSTFSGEQIAQVNNPDPFAAPVWRSPVYHTPGWLITIVQLLRAIKALIPSTNATCSAACRVHIRINLNITP